MPVVIIFSRMLSRILNLFGFGATTLVGKIALKLKPNILYHLSKGVKVVCVTGTNGKTTTCAMIEKGMIDADKSYFINKSGANMLSGIVTSFIKNSTLSGKCKREYAILECDENSLPLITNYLDSKIIVVTNVFRDQLDRYTEINTTLTKIIKGIHNSPNALLILNADCPITSSIASFCKNDVRYFGVEKSTRIVAPSDSVYCPMCNSKLCYHSVIFAHLGDYYCKSCGYKKAFSNFVAKDVVDNNGCYSFSLNDERYSLQIGGIYNLYNFLSCALALYSLDISYSTVAQFGGAFGRLETFYNGNSKIILLLVKNPVGFANCISYAKNLDFSFNAVFILNDNEADGKDVSWIWDVDFKPVSKKIISSYTYGIRKYDMCLRLKYDDIIANCDCKPLIEVIKETDENFVIFASYTAMMDIRHKLVENFGGDEFWR